MLHLVTGWKTHKREGEPAVLYCGTDPVKAKAAVDKNRTGFVRLEAGRVAHSFKIKQPIVHFTHGSAPIAPVPVAPDQTITPPEALARGLKIPTLEEVILSGVDESVALKIIACQQAKVDAFMANRNISDEELAKIQDQFEKQMTPSDFQKLTVEQLKAYALELEIDIKSLTKKADLIAAIQLSREKK